MASSIPIATRIATLLCLGCWLSWSMPAMATAPAAPPASDMPTDCAKATTQRQLNACAYSDFEVAQAAYTATFRDLTAGLDTAQRTLLRGAQTSWLQFRKSACDFEASGVRGGSAETMVRMRCQTRMTRERIAELRRHLQCAEGDLSCVRPSRRP